MIPFAYFLLGAGYGYSAYYYVRYPDPALSLFFTTIYVSLAALLWISRPRH